MSSRLRWTAQRLLDTVGVEVRRRPPAFPEAEHDLLVTLDLVAAHLAVLRPAAPLTLLQVGAFDGVSNDPVVDLIDRHGWHAVLVEPQPRPLAALRQRHEGNPRVQVFGVAVAETDGSRDLWTLDPVADLPPWAQQISSFHREHLLGQQRWLPQGVVEQRLTSVSVPTVTVETLLREAGVAHVDLLQVDVEGYDLRVLQLFDLPARLPAIVSFEHAHLSPQDRHEATELLRRNGYRFTRLHGDTLGYRAPSAIS